MLRRSGMCFGEGAPTSQKEADHFKTRSDESQ
jgi:hypothetical protein